MTTLDVRSEADAAEAARIAREMALAAGLGPTDAVALATAVSEVATNQVRHAGGRGTVKLSLTAEGVAVEASDRGPGIDDVELALSDGWSTAASLGLGLPGARRLVDDFAVESRPGQGTLVRMVKRLTATPAGPSELLSWRAAGRDPRLSAVAQEFASGITLALACREAAARVRERPAAPPARLLGRDGIVASLCAHDGHLTWQRAGQAHGVLLRGGSPVATAPLRRADQVRVLRGDVLLLAARPLPGPLRGHDPRTVSERAGGALVAAGRIARGVLERRPRSDMRGPGAHDFDSPGNPLVTRCSP